MNRNISDSGAPVTPRNWIAVACADHAYLGREHKPLGFMQVCHGKPPPLRRLRPGDRVVYYAPTRHFGVPDRLQSFVSIGQVLTGEPYQVDMGRGFNPWRRNVHYHAGEEAPIAPWLNQLHFVTDRQHWGATLRFGLLEIDDHDLDLIAQAMHSDLLALA